MSNETTQTEKKLLEVGDHLFDYKQWGGLTRLRIDKVTPKQAFAGHLKFHREITLKEKYYSERENVEVVKKIGEYGHAYLQTPELLTQYKGEQTINKARNLHQSFKASFINSSQAERLIALYESINAENEKT